MLREEPQVGDVFSITLHVRTQRPVFADLHFGRYCLGYLCALRHIVGHPVIAYCLMPDRVDLLVAAGPRGSVEGFVRRWKSLCTLEWRRRTDRGSFWEPGARDRFVRVEKDLAGETQRILQAPFLSGLVARAEDYPLSGSFERASAAGHSVVPFRGSVPAPPQTPRGQPRPVPRPS
jgi:hypothetical protein